MKRFLLPLFLLFTLSAQAQQRITFAWDAPDDPPVAPGGYEVRYGTTTGAYMQTVDAGMALTVTTPKIAPGAYFAAAFACNGLAAERACSGPSNEVAFTVRVTAPGTPKTFRQYTGTALLFTVPDDKIATVKLSFDNK